jgi:hypothetical protein
MTFALSDVVPWGRSFAEYVSMFRLTDADLTRSILGCGDGPASFNAELTTRGGRVVSADPLYRFSADQIRSRIDETTPIMIEQMTANQDAFLWTHFSSVAEVTNARLRSMQTFLEDYPGPGGQRYVDGSAPHLPFADQQFELALSSHFLFLYSEQRSLDFHVDAMLDLCRVATEVRVFPLLELSGVVSRHLDAVTSTLRERGVQVEHVEVPYRFQRGATEMLVARAPSQGVAV